MSRPFPTTDPTWDMESVFAGGPTSKTFQAELRWLESRVSELETALARQSFPANAPLSEEVLAGWRGFFDGLFELHDRLSQAFCFSSGMSSAHADDPVALRLPAQLTGVST